MKHPQYLLLVLILLSCSANKTSRSSRDPESSQISTLTSEFNPLPGFFDTYWDHQNGKLWMKVDKLDQEFLYVNSIVTGIGSNDIGLDRGQMGAEKVVKFVKNGPSLLLIQPNYRFRALSDNPAEVRAIEEAFARSVLGMFPIAESVPDGYLIDVTQFFLKDHYGIAGTLKRKGQGNYSLAGDLGMILEDRLRNFPRNTVIEAMLTFTGDPAGRYVREVVPSPDHISVIQRHALVALPDEDYEMRKFDPRAGYFGIFFYNYASDFDQPLEQHYIVRHRLKKEDPEADVSEPVEPIIYYLDPGVPEPVRSALLEGANWWKEAFEAAGYRNAFEVKMLPEGADMMDVRYNVIQWVHRSTRGWSYGRSIVDPRTGEIIKGHVSLGSLRVRQDFLIAQGLLSPYEGDETRVELAREMALARIRQLAAHEVGHTLGLAHNYASSVNDRASVMDYPHPLITLDPQGEINLSRAYDTGIGEWDKMAIRYGYSDHGSEKNTEKELEGIIREALDKELLFISDRDARPSGSAHPYAHLWDNRTNAADELNRIIGIREKALNDFGVNTLPMGAPYATLEDVLVPIYLLHRYQLEAASKLIGGLDYTYAMKGDGQPVTRIVSPEVQEMAIDAVLSTLEPEFLMIPESILQLIPPEPPGYYNDRERFGGKTGVTFDPLTAAESAASLTLTLLLHPERAARLVEYHARDPESPGLQALLDRLIRQTWKTVPENGYAGEIERVVDKLVLEHLIGLAHHPDAAGQVKALSLTSLLDLEQWLEQQGGVKDPSQEAHYRFAGERIRKFRDDPETFQAPERKPLPMGSPIGSGIHFSEE